MKDGDDVIKVGSSNFKQTLQLPFNKSFGHQILTT